MIPNLIKLSLSNQVLVQDSVWQEEIWMVYPGQESGVIVVPSILRIRTCRTDS